MKIYGTTIYIGNFTIDTKYGLFNVYSYQDLIHKGYIIAFSYGDINDKDILYTRIHSSCVTSETLRSMDCDCVQQLYGAFKTISEQGYGIIFYLIQEGRGCGYVGKSMACMRVQYNDEKITTFDAYEMLGMKKDYRNYSNIYDICKMLNIIDKEYILLTNNPDKINGLRDIGIKIHDVQSIEFLPNPFNQSYLISKEKTGHQLYYAKKKIQKYSLKIPKS